LVKDTVATFGGLHLAATLASVSVPCPISEAHLLKMTKINYFRKVWFIKQVAEVIVDENRHHLLAFGARRDL
jgi:hypothetical protein